MSEPTGAGVVGVGAGVVTAGEVGVGAGVVAGGVTTVGDRCMFMVGSHVGHDCSVGNDVTFANNAVLGGHVVVGDNVFFGGQAAVHQFVRIGEGAMIGGLSGASEDVMQFVRSFRPIRRMGTLDDVANAAEYLAGDLAGFISGQHLLLSGRGPA